jgi:hypothetical protein
MLVVRNKICINVAPHGIYDQGNQYDVEKWLYNDKPDNALLLLTNKII